MDRFAEALGEVNAGYTSVERPRGTVQQQVGGLGWGQRGGLGGRQAGKQAGRQLGVERSRGASA